MNFVRHQFIGENQTTSLVTQFTKCYPVAPTEAERDADIKSTEKVISLCLTQKGFQVDPCLLQGYRIEVHRNVDTGAEDMTLTLSTLCRKANVSESQQFKK